MPLMLNFLPHLISLVVGAVFACFDFALLDCHVKLTFLAALASSAAGLFPGEKPCVPTLIACVHQCSSSRCPHRRRGQQREVCLTALLLLLLLVCERKRELEVDGRERG